MRINKNYCKNDQDSRWAKSRKWSTSSASHIKIFLTSFYDTEATRVANFNILRVANFWCLIKDTEFIKISSSEFFEPQASNYQRKEGVNFTTKSLSMKGYVPSVVVITLRTKTILTRPSEIFLEERHTPFQNCNKKWW